METWTRLQVIAQRLSAISRENRYDVHSLFDWPESLSPDDYWISPELITAYGTDVWDELDEPARIELSHAEAVSFFSLNVHLIRELIGGVADRIYTTRMPGLSEFFHDFIAEENDHAWFFAGFCTRYGGKIYQSRAVSVGAGPGDDVMQDIGVFGRILIAEEMCDYFNAAMAEDDRLPGICRQINRVHHQDEARHIAFGRQMMRVLGERAAAELSEDDRSAIRTYLARYISVCLRSFYNREAYADAGLAEPGAIRSRLIADPARAAYHRKALERTVAFLEPIGMIDSALVRW